MGHGRTGADALRDTVELARHAERLGFHRYWLAEHHGNPMLACTSPEVLIAAVGGATSTLRVGSGGIMLPHYSPLKVAETFSVLAALLGDRVDLAVGRAAGTDPTTAWALQRDRRQRPPDDFPEQLSELLAYLDGALPPRHPFAHLVDLPGRPSRPVPWLLGSSPQSGVWAAEAGLPYAFADFINREGAAVATAYRKAFQPAASQPRPHVIVAASVICADTDEQARRVAAPARVVARRLREGRLAPVPPIDEALSLLDDGVTRPADGAGRRRGIVGGPERVKAGIEELAAEYGADEVMLLTITHGIEERRRSYELVGRAFGLA